MDNIFSIIKNFVKNIIENINKNFLISESTDYGSVTSLLSEENDIQEDFYLTDEMNPIENFTSIFIKKIIIKPEHEIPWNNIISKTCHFIVTNGVASVKINDDDFIYNEKQHFFIPKGSIFNIRNNGIFHLKLICIEISNS